LLHRAIRALEGILSPHVDLGKSRLETLCLLVVGMVSARTVNLGHIACERPGTALTASTYRRLQRFFRAASASARTGRCRSSRSCSGRAAAGPWCSTGRSGRSGRGKWTIWCSPSWRATSGCRSPGPCCRAAATARPRSCIALIKRYLAHFPASTIGKLLADREFIGADWLKFLNDNNIPFAIRLREDLRVVTADGCELTLFARLRGTRKTRTFRARLWADGGHDAETAPEFSFAVKRLATEWLIVVSNLPPRTALAAYRKRWAIECMFGDAKTRGLNLEDTRLTDPRKLDLLMALVTLALVWAGRTAVDLLARRDPKRKAHGYPAQSWFRIGLFRIRNLLRTDPHEAVAAWRRLSFNPFKIAGVV
jgi:hypothetical protein